MGPKLREPEHWFSYDELLILPSSSSVEPYQVSLESRVTKGIRVRVPIVSSPMDYVTESRMAIAMAMMGAIGAIHRNMSIDREVREVKRVKAVYGGEGATVDEDGRLRVIAASGPFDEERAMALERAGADAVLIDCAHGHNLRVVKFARRLRKKLSCELIVGNIVTPEAVRDYLDVADAFRVGLGSGSICITNEVTGVGAPQASAVHNVYLAARNYKIPVIADGGISSSGDIVKALALGADSVMLGYLLAGTDETPGRILNGELIGLKGSFKPYRGMGARSVIEKTDRYLRRTKHAPEGVEAIVEYRGSVKEVLKELVEGVKQGFGYVGAANIDELQRRAKFITVTPGKRKRKGLRRISLEQWMRLIGESP